MEDYFTTKNLHCEGKTILDLDSQGNIYTMGSDHIVSYLQLSPDNINSALPDPKLHYLDSQYSFLAVNPVVPDFFALAYKNNNSIRFVHDLSNPDYKEDSESTIQQYQNPVQINDYAFSPNGQLLGIGSQDVNPVVYAWRNNKKIKCRPAHSKPVITVFWSPDSTLFCTISQDSSLKVYLITSSSLESVMIFNTTLSKQAPKPEQRFLGAYSPDCSVLAMSGHYQLQEITVAQSSNRKHALSYSQKIKHDNPNKQITLCAWTSNEVLLTGSIFEEVLNIWNYSNKQKITTIPQCLLTSIRIMSNKTFCGVDSTGKLFKFSKPELLLVKSASVAHVKKPAQSPIKAIFEPELLKIAQESRNQSIQPQKIEGDNPTYNIKQENNTLAAQRPLSWKKPEQYKNQLEKLVPTLLQDRLRWDFEIKNHSRFLFYNSVGCIIQSEVEGKQTIQLELHNRSILNTRRIFLEDRDVLHFFIQPFSLRVAYASQNEFGFSDYEPDLPRDFKPNCWERPAEYIEGVTMGADWLAVLTYSGILIYDFYGQHLTTYAFDKIPLAAVGYENILAVVYHDGLPMYGHQCLRLRLFIVSQDDSDVVTYLDDTFLPLSPNSELTHFSFTEEGMLVCQDSTGRVQAYLSAKGQWFTIFTPPADSKKKYMLVYMREYKMFGFVLPEDESQPSVLPRSIPQEFPAGSLVASFAAATRTDPEQEATNNFSSVQNPQKTKAIDQLYNKYVYSSKILEHERYRNKLWYQYKYARTKKGSPYYSQSASILTDDELEQRQLLLDLDLLNIVSMLVKDLKQMQKAFWLIRSYIHSEKRASKFVKMFEELGEYPFADRLDKHFLEVTRMQEYRNKALLKRGSTKLGAELQRNLLMLPTSVEIKAEAPKKRTMM